VRHYHTLETMSLRATTRSGLVSQEQMAQNVKGAGITRPKSVLSLSIPLCVRVAMAL